MQYKIEEFKYVLTPKGNIMMTALRFRIAIFLALAAFAAFLPGPLPADELPRNFHEVDPVNRIYRSAQPDREEFATLEERGFRTILNLRQFHSDHRKLRNRNLISCAVPCNAGNMNEEQLYQALRILRDQPKPLLIHCWHGSDRTGSVVAAFRIVCNGWKPEAAIAEMLEEKYGHHAGIYANLPELLRSVNWDEMRNRIQTEDVPQGTFSPREVLHVHYSPEPFRVTITAGTIDGTIPANADATATATTTATDSATALALIQQMWKEKSCRALLLIFDSVPENSTLYDPFAAAVNNLPEMDGATRYDAIPAPLPDDGVSDAMRTLNDRLGLPEDAPARIIRVVPHRLTWSAPDAGEAEFSESGKNEARENPVQ